MLCQIASEPVQETDACGERLVGSAGVPRLADGEGNVAVFNHMLDLFSHCTHTVSPDRSPWTNSKLTGQSKQNQPVHDQHGPKHGQIENLPPAAEEANGNSLCGRVPELEFGEAADKGAELLVFFCGQAAGVAVFHAFVLFERGVEFRGQEGEEEV